MWTQYRNIYCLFIEYEKLHISLIFYFIFKICIYFLELLSFSSKSLSSTRSIPLNRLLSESMKERKTAIHIHKK